MNAADPGPEGFYVTVKRDSRTGYLLGPFASKDAAATHVQEGKRIARDVDPFTAFDAFGVTRVVMQPGAELPAGKVNHLASDDTRKHVIPHG